MRDAVICAIVLHEDRVLDEWIVYHRGLGFQRIYLYDNSPEFDLREWPERYSGFLQVLHIPGRVMQLTAYNHFLQTFGAAHTWCAFIDADEFIVLKKHPNVVSMLEEHCPNGALTLNWYMFGSSGRKEYSPEPVTFRFQLRAPAVDRHIKTIAHLASLELMGIHECYRMREGMGVPRDTRGDPVMGPYNPEGPTDIAVIHHYNAKSWEEYQWKIARGRADNGEARTIEQFYEADQGANEVLDSSAWDRYAQALGTGM